ncbi:uncharacterized protein LOC143369499 [Andrena cerasifolii]|uniref:uncharacterized protein LOC143369499 n=1 Tax=Andrena cerasifolii TaxID=2819439 RepID=UPI004037E5A0
MILPWIILINFNLVWALIGYDCNGQHLNVTTVSLNSVGDSEINPISTATKEIYIQLLQLSDFNYVEVIQCKLIISRTIYYCGMHSHVSAVHNGLNEYLEDLTEHQCRNMHEYGSTVIGNNVYLVGLKMNQTSTRTFTMAGSLTAEGKCTGAQFSDPYGSWEKVVVQAMAKITLKTALVPARLELNKIILQSGTICHFQNGFCVDNEDGHTFWHSFPPSTCKFDRYDVLYEGLASKITDTSQDEVKSPSVYALITQDITFALTPTGEQHLCGYTLIQTEHPKLFILETTKERTFASLQKIPVENLDIFTYVNSKFVYVEKHIRTELKTLYRDIIIQKCLLEQQILYNALIIATLKPDEFANIVTKTPGHMALVAGEVIHIVKCIPVQVKIRKTDECYIEIHVWLRNNSMLLTPKSHILTIQGTHRECSPILPVMYEIDQAWHRISPHPIEVRSPQVLHPKTKLNWHYTSPSDLATSGIYTQKELENLRDHIMFPAEKAAVLNTLARGISAKNIPAGSISIMGILDEETITTLAENAAAEFWNGFLKFGTVTAGLLGVFIIIKIIKTLFDTIIHGHQIHAVYGCGLHLLGAIWNSLTTLIIHLANKKQPSSQNADQLTTDEGRQPTPAAREFKEAIQELKQISSGSLISKGGGVTSRDVESTIN